MEIDVDQALVNTVITGATALVGGLTVVLGYLIKRTVVTLNRKA